MRHRFVLFVLITGLSAACRSGGDGTQPTPPTPASAAPAKPTEPQAAQPMLSIRASPAVQSQATPPAATQASPRAERLAALSKDHENAMNAYYEALDKARGGKENPTPEEWQKIMAEVKAPDEKAFEARAQQLLDEDPSDLTALQTISWMLANTSRGAASEQLVAILEKHHLDRPEMGAMCSMLAQNAPSLVARLLAKSPHVEVRGQACNALAEGLKDDLRTAEHLRSADAKNLENMKGYLGEEKLTALQKLDIAKTQAEIEAYYERIVKEFGDVKVNVGTKRETTLGKRASAALFETRNLTVGKLAPEIEGVDLDKVAFKLSDYRGKVVLLDFWGNW